MENEEAGDKCPRCGAFIPLFRFRGSGLGLKGKEHEEFCKGVEKCPECGIKLIAKVKFRWEIYEDV